MDIMENFEKQTPSKPVALIGTFVVLSIAYIATKVIYVLYFHPLHKIPGPKINAFTRLPYIRHLLAGTTCINVVDLHAKYGEVVRLSPTQISFISGETAWPEIYGFRTGKLRGRANFQKDPAWYAPPSNGSPSILIADDENHTRGRRLLSHAFSDKALAEQEMLLQKYADQLIARLKEVTSTTDEPVDMVKWYNWTTFDIIADLLFGEPFGCLQDLSTHRVVEGLLKSFKAFRFYYVIKYFPWLKYLGSLVIDQQLLRDRMNHARWVSSQVQKRMSRDTQRPDFMTYILKHNNQKGETTLSVNEIDSNAMLFIGAGSETTATLLSAVTFHLLKNPAVMQKLKDEIRGRWKSYFEITQDEVNNAPYLIAVLSEGLRVFPPVPTGFERQVPKGGEVVNGYFIPEGTAVSVSQYPTNHSENNFKDAEKFVPERWMGDPKYAQDKRTAMQPFSFGPRNCLGKNLAYAEMRLILAKMIWSFDLELDPRSQDWSKECKVMLLWDKPELAVRVKEVVRS